MCRHALLVFLFLITLTAGGCGGLLPDAGPAPVFYRFDYDPPPVDCPRVFDEGIRIREFSSASPYDRQEMIVLKPQGEVSFSGTYQWVATPGKMVAQSLERDLSAGNLFSSVSMGEDPSLAPLELTGRIYTFAWKQSELEGRAVLKVEISLRETAGESRILLHRIYRIESPGHTERKANQFAAAMSELARELSLRLQEDLCSLARGEGE